MLEEGLIMMKLFDFFNIIAKSGVTCGDLAPFMRIINYLLGFVKFIIPVILIIYIVVDFLKAIFANDEKKINEAKTVAIKRIFYAVLLFLIPTIITFIFKSLGNVISGNELTNAAEWISCFNRFN